MCLAAALVLAPALDAHAQGTALDSTHTTESDTVAGQPLSLEDAIRLAGRSSDALRIARAGVEQARSQQVSARGQSLPQLSLRAGYTRTIASPFRGMARTSGTPTDTGALQALCTPPLAANATAAERAAALAQAASCSSISNIDLSRAGIGVKNSYNVEIDGSFDLIAPGRGAQRSVAEAGRSSADIEVTAQRAQLVVDVTEAYYDAALSDRLVAIAESSLTQSARVLRQARAAYNVGDQSGYELLRAQVAHDNQLPTVVQQRTNRELAYVRLRQLLDLDPDETIQLAAIPEMTAEPPATTLVAALGSDTGIPTGLVRAANDAGVDMTIKPSDTSVAARAPVRQQEEVVRQQEATFHLRRAQRLPSVSVSANFGKVAYPVNLFPTASQLFSNASVGLSISLPLYTGGLQRANELSAEASLEMSQSQLSQTRKSAALDSRQALLTLSQAEASLAATGQTATQATRAYQIAEVRYQEGLATQTEVSDARIAETQALSNRAQAVRDVIVARVRLALLRDLPLSAPSTSAPSSTSTTTVMTTVTGSQAMGMDSSRTAATTTSQTSSTVRRPP